MGKLIIIEGSDGSGKQTQSELLYKKLFNKLNKVIKINFPNYDSDSSALVKMYLNGEFGDKPTDVNAYTSSLFFAVDRFASYKKIFEKPYKDNYIVISDRYTTSNMVHQASKIDDEKEKSEFLNWLEDLEYNKVGLPKPDIVIYLNVPYEYTEKLILNRLNKIDGKEDKDIHESNLSYLKKCNESSLNLAFDKKWTVIECVKNGEMRSIEDINEEILAKLEGIL